MRETSENEEFVEGESESFKVPVLLVSKMVESLTNREWRELKREENERRRIARGSRSPGRPKAWRAARVWEEGAEFVLAITVDSNGSEIARENVTTRDPVEAAEEFRIWASNSRAAGLLLVRRNGGNYYCARNEDSRRSFSSWPEKDFVARFGRIGDGALSENRE